VYDNYSTDSSWDILNAHPLVEAIRFDTNNNLSNDTFLSIKNHAWKKDVGNTDWQIVCDIDEFIWHKNLPALLQKYLETGITLPKVAGFNMVSDSFPLGDTRQLWEFIHMGAPYYRPSFNKRAVFRPTEQNLHRSGIKEIHYHSGCHSCAPSGDLIDSVQTEIRLLHYRCFGEEYCVERARLNLARMSKDRNEGGTKAWYQNQINDYKKFSQLDKVYNVFDPEVDLNLVFNSTKNVVPGIRKSNILSGANTSLNNVGNIFIPKQLRLHSLSGRKP
jgi:hypothetical protein